jgi:hypothetical protein
VLLWIGAAGLLGVAALYAILALDVVPPDSVDPGVDPGAVRSLAALVAAAAASLAAGHAAAAFGLTTSRPWGRVIATMVCVVWALTCVGLPVGLLGVSAMWRSRPVPPSPPAVRPPP